MFSVTVIWSDPALNTSRILPKYFERSIERGRVERSFFLLEMTEGIDLSTPEHSTSPIILQLNYNNLSARSVDMTASFCP